MIVSQLQNSNTVRFNEPKWFILLDWAGMRMGWVGVSTLAAITRTTSNKNLTRLTTVFKIMKSVKSSNIVLNLLIYF